jgi:S-adenosylhomocysteine hydrolase
MDANENDVSRFRSLEACITQLRAKYQQCGFDLPATAGRFREMQRGQFTHDELPRLLNVAKTVDADFRAIPTQLLHFAEIHRARLHTALLDGYCFGAAEELDREISTRREPESDSLVRYLCENVARLLDSAVNLLDFDISMLSTGYLSSEKVDFRLLESSDLLLATACKGWLIQVFGRAQGRFREVGRYVARKTPLRRPILWSDETQKAAMYADGGPYLYRWDLHSSTPEAEFDSGGHSAVSFDIFRRGSLGTEIVAYAYDRGCWLLDPVSLRVRETLDDSAPWKADCAALWWDDGEARYHGVFKGSETTTSIWSHQLGADGSLTGRADLKEILERTYEYLLVGGTSGADTRLEVSQVISIELAQIKGAPCVIVCVQLWSRADQGFSDALAFLDPYRLQPIRPPIIAGQEIARFGMVSDRKKSLMVATLRDSWSTASAFAVWDVSNFVDRTPRTPLKQWPQERFDSHNLCLANREREQGWDAYYTVSNNERGQPGPSEVRRLDGEAGGSERVLESPERVFEMSLLEQGPCHPDEKPGSIRVYAEGKTDYVHLQAALSYFHARGFYQQLELNFAEAMEMTGDDQLLKQCKALASEPPARTVVFMFDRDNPKMIQQVSGGGSIIRRWGDRVFSFAIPVPTHRVGEPRICIEMYYEDTDLRRTDAEGRRLFLRKEFNDRGFHRSEPFIWRDREKQTLVVESNVYDSSSQKSMALSKSAFAEYVKNQVPPFDQVGFEAFRQILDVFVTILQRDPGLLPQSDTDVTKPGIVKASEKSPRQSVPLSQEITERPFGQFPMLHLATNLLKRNVGNSPFANLRVAFVLHYLTDLLPFAQGCLELGLVPGQAVFFVKSDYQYPHKEAIAEWLRRKGFGVQGVEAKEAYVRELESTLTADSPRLLIVEDGGYLVPYLHETHSKLLPTVIGAVEQTTKGLRKLEGWGRASGGTGDLESLMQFPLLSIPDSTIKRNIEPPIIGDQVVRCIQALTNHLSLHGLSVGLLGLGTIGMEVFKHLKNVGAQVMGYDKEEAPRIAFKMNGGLLASTPMEAVREKRLVIGCSGQESITSDVIAQLMHGAFVVSASSDLVEINRNYLEDRAVDQIRLPIGDREWREGELWAGTRYILSGSPKKEINLLADGYPVTFWGFPGMPHQGGDLIMTVILVAAAELAARNGPAGGQGIIPYANKICREEIDELARKYQLLAEYRRLYP